MQIVHETIFGKYSTLNKVNGVPQMLECLPRKHEARVQTPVQLKKKKKKKKKYMKDKNAKQVLLGGRY
jgi:hypothetical protein